MSVSPAECPRLRRLVPGLIVGLLVAGALSVLAPVLATVLATVPAAATDHSTTLQPLRLVPPATLAPTGVPVPGHSVIETGIGSATETTARRSGDIEINPLDEIAPDSIGTLDPGSGGFGMEKRWGGG